MRILALYLGALLLVCACNNASVSSPIPFIDIKQAVDNVHDINLSLYISDIKYLPLQSNDNSIFLGDVSKFAIDENHIYIAGYGQSQIHIFSKNGRYLKSIGKKGRGPGEYIAIRSINPMPEKNAVLIEGGYKSIVYSLNDNSTISEVEYNQLLENENREVVSIGAFQTYTAQQYIHSIIPLNGYLYIHIVDKNEFSERLLVVSDDSYSPNVIKRIGLKDVTITETSKHSQELEPSSIYKANNEISILNAYADTIYAIKNNEPVVKLFIKYGHYPYPRTSNINREQLLLEPEPIETDSLIFATMYMPVERPVYNTTPLLTNNDSPTQFTLCMGRKIDELNETRLIYNKSTGKSAIPQYYKKYEMAGLQNDLDGGIPFWPDFAHEKKLYQFIDAGKFIELSKTSNSNKMKEIAATLTDESNPIVIEATLK